MSIAINDRSSFSFLASKVIEFISTFDEPVVILGESFGGLLAAYIASRAKSKVSKVVLVNPATSFDQTMWPILGSLISNLGPGFAPIGTAALALTVVEPYQIQLFGQEILDRIQSTEDAIREIGDLLNTPNKVATRLPPETLRWRLNNWLKSGTYIMENKYESITAPTLVLIGTQDRLLPSAKEGVRLKRVMTKSVVEVMDFNSNGHAFLDGSQNLTDIFAKSQIFGTPVPEPPIQDYYPSAEDIRAVETQLAPIFRGASSIFLTRTADGRLKRGIADIPTGQEGRPVLLVGNHQLYGILHIFIITLLL